MTTLISFLGVGNKQNGGYRTTNYQFSDGEVFEQTRYIGMALAQKIKPTKVILLGTSGSMWDVFWKMLAIMAWKKNGWIYPKRWIAKMSVQNIYSHLKII